MEIKGINKEREDSQAEIGHNGRRPTQKEIRDRAIKQILEDLEEVDPDEEALQEVRNKEEP